MTSAQRQNRDIIGALSFIKEGAAKVLSQNSKGSKNPSSRLQKFAGGSGQYAAIQEDKSQQIKARDQGSGFNTEKIGAAGAES